MRRRRGLIMLMSLSLIFSAAIIGLRKSTHAESLTRTLGSKVIENGDVVWFGQHNSDPILWQVLANGSDSRLPVSGLGEALLFSIDILEYVTFANLDDDENFENDWQGSNAQAWCTSLLDNVTNKSAEKAAIKRTSVAETNDKLIVDTQDGAIHLENSYYYQGGYHDDYYCSASLSNELFFFLSAQEADTYFTDDDDRVVHDPAPWLDNSWWLRSPSGFEHGVGWVTDDGEIESLWEFSKDDDGHGARPAFNLNLSHVIFASENPSYVNTYKLTLIDSSRTIGIQSGEKLTRSDATSMTVPYTIDNDSDRVSLLITSKDSLWSGVTGWSDDAVMQYYTSEKVFESTGNVTFILPDDYEINKNNWKVWILAEKTNGAEASDFASEPLELSIPEL